MRAFRLPVLASLSWLVAVLGTGCLVQPEGAPPGEEARAAEAPQGSLLPIVQAGGVSAGVMPVIGATATPVTRTSPGITFAGPTPDPWHGGSQSGPTPDPWDPDHRRAPVVGTNTSQGSDSPGLDQRPPK